MTITQQMVVYRLFASTENAWNNFATIKEKLVAPFKTTTKQKRRRRKQTNTKTSIIWHNHYYSLLSNLSFR